MHSFRKKLKQGKRAERYLDSVFSNDFRIYEVGMEDERRGIDRYFVKRDTGKRYAIQYKADERACKTGNAFVETVSVDRDNVPGWVYTCEADFILYYIDDIGPIYILRPNDIRRKLPTWERLYKTAVSKNKTYNTIGIKVPLGEFERLAVQIVNA